jgi:hypothetical protein
MYRMSKAPSKGGWGSWLGGIGGGSRKPPPLSSKPPDLGNVLKNPGKGGGPVPPSGKGKQPPTPPTPPKGGISATTGATLAGGAGIAGILAGSIPGVLTTVQAGFAADAAKKGVEGVENVVENLTEFLSRPEVIAGAVGITALVVLGPTIAAMASNSKK